MTGTLKGLISALIGHARWKIGGLLLKLFILRNRKAEQEQLFTQGWKFVHRFQWLFLGRQLYQNRFQKNWESFAFTELVRAVKKHNPLFVPKVITKNRELLAEPAKRGSPIMVATIHTGTEACLNRMFEELGMESAVIAASKIATQNKAALFGLKGTVDVIGRTSDTFLIARRKIKDGKVICCCADFTAREVGTLYHDRFLATGLFDFAKLAKAAIVYAIPTLSETGEITINLSQPGIDSKNSTVEELAQDFIRFVSVVTKENRVWKIGSWTPKMPGSPPKYSKYWIARAS